MKIKFKKTFSARHIQPIYPASDRYEDFRAGSSIEIDDIKDAYELEAFANKILGSMKEIREIS